MCDCIDSIVDRAICHHNPIDDALNKLKINTLPIIKSNDLFENIKDMIDANNDEIITINLYSYIPTNKSKDVFYRSTRDNIPCDYVFLIEYDKTLYKLYPNDEMERLISDKKNYISADDHSYMRISFKKDNTEIIREDFPRLSDE